MIEDLEDLGIFVLSEECELIENTLQIMKYVWGGLVLSGIVMYFR